MIKNKNTNSFPIQEKLYNLLARYPKFSVADFRTGKSNMPDTLYQELYSRYLDAMPYGPVTGNVRDQLLGRVGDPIDFVTDKLVEELYQIERGF